MNSTKNYHHPSIEIPRQAREYLRELFRRSDNRIETCNEESDVYLADLILRAAQEGKLFPPWVFRTGVRALRGHEAGVYIRKGDQPTLTRHVVPLYVMKNREAGSRGSASWSPTPAPTVFHCPENADIAAEGESLIRTYDAALVWELYWARLKSKAVFPGINDDESFGIFSFQEGREGPGLHLDIVFRTFENFVRNMDRKIIISRPGLTSDFPNNICFSLQSSVGKPTTILSGMAIHDAQSGLWTIHT